MHGFCNSEGLSDCVRVSWVDIDVPLRSGTSLGHDSQRQLNHPLLKLRDPAIQKSEQVIKPLGVGQQ